MDRKFNRDNSLINRMILLNGERVENFYDPDDDESSLAGFKRMRRRCQMHKDKDNLEGESDIWWNDE